ncbi:MAG: PAS domain-containing protein [Methanobacteriota archaeon]
MSDKSEEEADFASQRKKIIGLGDGSIRKSYYPELQKQVVELKRKNEELQAANEEIVATQEELHQNYEELLQKEQELMESRASFQEVLENSIVALYKRDNITGFYEYMSPAITSIVGYTPIEMMRFSIEDVSAMIHPDDLVQVRKVMQGIITQGGGQCILEYRFKHKNGQEHWAKDISRIFIDLSGELQYSIGSIQDITDHKRVELTLQTAQKKLNLLNTVTFQDVLNANYALSGYIELIRDSNTDEKLYPYQGAAEALVQKIENSLKCAKYYQDMGIMPPIWHTVSIVFLNAISHLDASTITRSMHLEGLECYADPLLEHAFFNIIENVFLHSERANHLTISYHEDANTLFLIIEDDGVGIPNDQKESIFEKSHVRSKGMGLFLVREILSITGISIIENGVSGKGARFEIQIPPGGYRFYSPKDKIEI